MSWARSLLHRSVPRWSPPWKHLSRGDLSTCVKSAPSMARSRALHDTSSGLDLCSLPFRPLSVFSLRRATTFFITSGRASSLAGSLTPALLHRLNGLIAPEKAQFMWSNRASIPMNAKIRTSLHIILASLQDPEHRWAQPIGFIIPRDPHFDSVGDASGLAGGTYCEVLMFWFNITWSDRITASPLRACQNSQSP
jgi:hypothetical protein